MTTREARYDLIIIGAGPAGLSAAIGAESEGVNSIVLDSADQLGGQAGTSSLIENYPGFPGGISGRDLTARIIEQALEFNSEFLAPWRAQAIEVVDDGLAVRDDSEIILGRMVLVGCGVDYRRLVVPNLAAYLGRGINYGSPRASDTFSNKVMYVVGGANSAGQAAIHLSKFTDCKVHMLVRGPRIADKMSAYLVDRIRTNEKIEVHTDSEVVGVDGDSCLRELTIKTGDQRRKVNADEVFILIGAAPKTMWLPEVLDRDKYGFIKAGGDIDEEKRYEFVETHGRPPLSHETSVPGLFVAGDVRHGTIKRVASAVGDGAQAIPDVHRYLALLADKKVA